MSVEKLCSVISRNKQGGSGSSELLFFSLKNYFSSSTEEWTVYLSSLVEKVHKKRPPVITCIESFAKQKTETLNVQYTCHHPYDETRQTLGRDGCSDFHKLHESLKTNVILSRSYLP